MRNYIVTVYEQTDRVAMVKLTLGDDSEREDAEAAAIREAQRNPAMWGSPTTDYYGDVEDVTPRPDGTATLSNGHVVPFSVELRVDADLSDDELDVMRKLLTSGNLRAR